MAGIARVIYWCRAHSERTARICVPIESYGVWDRSDKVYLDDTNPKSDFIKGYRIDASWSDIQPTVDGGYYWSFFLTLLDSAVATDRYVYANILVGPDSPT